MMRKSGAICSIPLSPQTTRAHGYHLKQQSSYQAALLWPCKGTARPEVSPVAWKPREVAKRRRMLPTFYQSSRIYRLKAAPNSILVCYKEQAEFNCVLCLESHQMTIQGRLQEQDYQKPDWGTVSPPVLKNLSPPNCNAKALISYFSSVIQNWSLIFKDHSQPTIMWPFLWVTHSLSACFFKRSRRNSPVQAVKWGSHITKCNYRALEIM